jgi:acylphosphatase
MDRRGFRITGRVQGVAFRAWTRHVARELGLSGTVRNLADGAVEVHAAGPRKRLEEFEARLWEGPPASKVDGVEGVVSLVEVPVETFRILY